MTSVELLVNCPLAKEADEVRNTLNRYLLHGECSAPVEFIKITRDEGYVNTTARFTVGENKKVEFVLRVIQAHGGLIIFCEEHTYFDDGKKSVEWSIHHFDKFPKKIEMIIKT
jgi:hypothetical protein